MDFYSDFKKIVLAQPRNAVNSRSVENSFFGDYLLRCKNIYLGFFLTDASDCFYGEQLNKCLDCVDCDYLSSCELCYECFDSTSLYNCSFLQDCHGCSECDFSFDLLNCKNCFGSFGLRHKQFCIFNKQYAEEDYHKKVRQLRISPPLKTLEILQDEFDKHPRLSCRQLKGGENSFGDYIYFSKNAYSCFNVRNVSNAMHSSNILSLEYPSSDCADCCFGSQLESCYECENTANCSNCNFLKDCVGCSDTEYAINCYNCMDCFGCAYLENKQYCILNRQLTKPEYDLVLKKIKGDIKAAGTYGKTLADILI